MNVLLKCSIKIYLSMPDATTSKFFCTNYWLSSSPLDSSPSGDILNNLLFAIPTFLFIVTFTFGYLLNGQLREILKELLKPYDKENQTKIEKIMSKSFFKNFILSSFILTIVNGLTIVFRLNDVFLGIGYIIFSAIIAFVGLLLLDTKKLELFGKIVEESSHVLLWLSFILAFILAIGFSLQMGHILTFNIEKITICSDTLGVSWSVPRLWVFISPFIAILVIIVVVSINSIVSERKKSKP